MEEGETVSLYTVVAGDVRFKVFKTDARRNG